MPSDSLRLLCDVIRHKSSIRDVQLVLKSGADSNGVFRNGLRPLHYAAFSDYAEVIPLLVAWGANPNFGDDIGYTPLHLAAKSGYYDTCRQLIEHGAKIGFFDAESADAPAGGKLLQHMDVHPLQLALEENHVSVVRLLLRNGADPNHRYFIGHEINMVPLEHTRCVELLLQFGADPDARSRSGYTPLMKATKLKNLSAMRLLIKHGAQLDAVCSDRLVEQRTALHLAVAGGDVRVVDVLLLAGASTERQPCSEESALTNAVLLGEPEVVALLLARGADPNEVNQDSTTPLQAAVSSCNSAKQLPLCTQLLIHGANPNYFCAKYSSFLPSLCPLLEYVKKNEKLDVELVRMLLQYGATVKMLPALNYSLLQHPDGFLNILEKIEKHPAVLDLFLEAASHFPSELVIRQVLQTRHSLQAQLIHLASSPRQLLHLARLSVRRNLGEKIPSKINHLRLPNQLQKLLLYQS